MTMAGAARLVVLESWVQSQLQPPYWDPGRHWKEATLQVRQRDSGAGCTGGHCS